MAQQLKTRKKGGSHTGLLQVLGETVATVALSPGLGPVLATTVAKTPGVVHAVNQQGQKLKLLNSR